MAAALTLHGAAGASSVTVTAEPATGRIQVFFEDWSSEAGGSYLHVALGTRDGDSCDVVRRVVADPSDLSATAAYEPDGTPLPVQHFEVGAPWAQKLSRVAIPAFAPVDCVVAKGRSGADPADPGATISSSTRTALVPSGFGTGHDIFPATVACPTEVPAGGQLDITVGYTTDPSPSWYYLAPRPSGFGAMSFTVDPSPDFTGSTSPEPQTNVDLWTDEPWNGDLLVDLDPSELYFVRPEGTVAIDGAEASWACAGRIPVTVPVPTDWVGSLAGESWWSRGEGSNSGIGGYALHQVYEFLDDEWVYFEDEYFGPRTEPCASGVAGCYRYYYDEDSNRLQIGNRLALPGTGTWGMPAAGGSYATYSVSHSIRPVTTGQRFAYTGTSDFSGPLTLRRDGTYTCKGCTGTRHTFGGRYRFIGGDVQELVLHKRGADFRSGVVLYYAKHDGRAGLFDIDTGQRLFRVQRW